MSPMCIKIQDCVYGFLFSLLFLVYKGVYDGQDVASMMIICASCSHYYFEWFCELGFVTNLTLFKDLEIWFGGIKIGCVIYSLDPIFFF